MTDPTEFLDASGYPNSYDRVQEDATNRSRLVFGEGEPYYVQAAEINEVQSIIAQRHRRLGNLVAKDGDRQSGAAIILTDAGATLTATLGSGTLYIKGDVRSVDSAIITGLPKTGTVTVGVKLQKTVITADDDPTLLGLRPGTPGEGEPGAARIEEALVWALKADAQVGEYYTVYTITDGSVVDNGLVPALSGAMAVLAPYDYDAHGNYIVTGTEVQALGRDGANQRFLIAPGRYNAMGYKKIRETSRLVSRAEDPDLEVIAAEPHTFTGTDGGSATIAVNRAPIGAITAAVVEKRAVQVVTRGSVPGGIDPLGFASVTAIESVVQGGTTYASPASYVQSGDGVSWAGAGPEPASGSTYTVTYRYYASVTPDAVTDTSVTVTGGVNGRSVLLSYTSKLPRIDIIGMNMLGEPVYVKGVSRRVHRLPPPTPSDLTLIATVSNDWMSTPVIVNSTIRALTFEDMWRKIALLEQVVSQMGRVLSAQDVQARAGVAAGRIFTDDFTDDYYRDQGYAQGLAVNNGALMLPLDMVQTQRLVTDAIMLPYTEEIIVSQPLRTSAHKINPYANYSIMPGAMTLSPAVDFWTDTQTVWTSAVTRDYLANSDTPEGTVTTTTDVISTVEAPAQWLRAINVVVHIAGFAAGENLATLTLGGINVKPAGTQTAGSDGTLNVTVAIPANTIPAGAHVMHATGAANSFAQTIFVGQGTITTETMRRVNLVARHAVFSITNVTNVTNIIQQVTPTVVDNGWSGGGGESGSGSDPVAQGFRINEGRHLLGVNIRMAAIGDPANGIRMLFGPAVNGYPSNQVTGEAFITLGGVAVNDLVPARIKYPVWYDPTQYWWWKLLTADDDHAIWVAKLGDVDAATQQRISANPFTVGDFADGSNNLGWNLISDTDACFDVVAAKFTSTTRRMLLWTGAITNVSDVKIPASAEIPTADTSVVFELVRASGEVIKILPNGTHEFAEFVTETVSIYASLTGTEKASPILHAAQVLFYRMRTSDIYVSRVFEMAGNGATAKALCYASLPSGSSLTVSVDADDDSWHTLDPASTRSVGNGWTEPLYSKSALTLPEGRIKLALTGTPAARPKISKLRSWTE